MLPPAPFLLSVIAPCHNEAGNLERLHDALQSTLATLDLEFELVLVDDCSSDETWSALWSLAERHPRVRGIRLSRNFGQMAALLAGLRAARGDAVVTMDADLQHPPEVIPLLIREWQAGAKVVHTERADAEETGIVQRVTSRCFYKIFALLTGVPVAAAAGEFRLLDRQVVDELLRLREGEYFMRGVVSWLGFRSAVVPYRAAPRHAGRTSYSLLKRLRLAASALVSFSVIPLRIGIGLGLATATLAFAYLMFAVMAKLAGKTTPGWASAVGVTSLLFGIQFILTGLVGEYLARVHIAEKRRPSFVIDETTDAADPTRERGDVRAAASQRRHVPGAGMLADRETAIADAATT